MKFKKEINKIEKGIEKEVKEIENWMIERKKFFIKLGWVSGVIAIIIIISNLYLK